MWRKGSGCGKKQLYHPRDFPEVQGLLQRAPLKRHRIPGPLIKHENRTSPLKSIFPKNTVFSLIKLNYQINTTRSTGSRHAVVTVCLAPTTPTAELAACVTQVFPSYKLVKPKHGRTSGRHKNCSPERRASSLPASSSSSSPSGRHSWEAAVTIIQLSQKHFRIWKYIKSAQEDRHEDAA